MNKTRSTINKDWLLHHPEYRKKYNARIRNEVLYHYSNGTMACACCGVTEIKFLTLDHVNGGGTKHREVTGNGGNLASWLKAHDYPFGYRVLCCNCNFSIGHYGYCPHSIPEEEDGS